MANLDRLKEAQRAAQMAAAQRYAARTSEREKVKAAVAVGGPGAADSASRQMRYKARVESLGRARALSRAGLLPIGLERKIGATLDYVPFAPSEASRKAGRPVARIVDNIGAGLLPEGFATGFLITTNLLMTNHHVFPTRSDATGIGANFLYEKSDRGTEAGVVFELDPARFYVSDEALDFAIVAVKSKAIDATTLESLGVITLIEATPKILRGQPVNIIQYPDGGPKQYAVSQNRLVDILEKEGFLHYETDTLGGSSGSPAFSENWELVALHHAGIPEMKNGRVIATDGRFWTEEMGDDRVHWVANEGVRVSAIVGKLAGMTLENPAEQAILHDLMTSTTDPVDDLNHGVAALAVAGTPEAAAHAALGLNLPGDHMANNQFTFTGPVTIHIYAPGAPMPAVAAVAPPAMKIEEASIRFDPKYANREGYDPAFLDPHGQIRVPTPTIAQERLDEVLKAPNGKPLVLKYHHFELVMNEDRRLQMWSATNVDYNPARKAQGGRDSFGKDKWILDKRIPAAAQLTDPDFYKPAGKIDRGHIVRREDNAWGDSDSEIEFANSDTFHWTNCTPQHEAFNRSSPGGAYGDMKGLWGDFENYIQQSRKGNDTKACILAGPILDEKDPTADFGDGDIAYPIRFWKVICVVEPAGAHGKALHVFGFILSQKPVTDKFGIEAFGPGRFKRYQVSLTKISEQTGVIFDAALHAADVMHGAPEALRINNFDQVVGLTDRAAARADAEAPVA
jgi:endonuclease G